MKSHDPNQFTAFKSVSFTDTSNIHKEEQNKQWPLNYFAKNPMAAIVHVYAYLTWANVRKISHSNVHMNETENWKYLHTEKFLQSMSYFKYVTRNWSLYTCTLILQHEWFSTRHLSEIICFIEFFNKTFPIVIWFVFVGLFTHELRLQVNFFGQCLMPVFV